MTDKHNAPGEIDSYRDLFAPDQLHNVDINIALHEAGADIIKAYDQQAAEIARLRAVLKSLADPQWWDMESPETAQDFAAEALKGETK